MSSAISKSWILRKFKALFLVANVLILSPVPGQADEAGSGFPDVDPKVVQERMQEYAKKEADSAAAPSPEGIDRSAIFPEVWCSQISDAETRTICWKAYQQGLEYYQFGLDHRKSVLKWQHVSTQIILVIVLILVGMGLYFAWVQFRLGETQQAQNTIELSMKGVKVSSPVLGVIILTLSLGFFYLYLIYVYPIKEVI